MRGKDVKSQKANVFVKINPTNDFFESTNCSMVPFWKSGLNIFCIDSNEAKKAENIITGPTMDNKKFLSVSLISGNNIAVRKNRMMPVRLSLIHI